MTSGHIPRVQINGHDGIVVQHPGELTDNICTSSTEEYHSCENGLSSDATPNVHAKPLPALEEVMDINKLWKYEYDRLQKQFNQMKAQLQEDNLKLKQEVHKSELRCTMLETKNLALQSELIRLARMFEAIHPHQNMDTSSKSCKDSDNDVDLIKEQLRAYKEDFKLEHQDKQKVESEKLSLQEKLLQCEKHLHNLNKELVLYKQECKRLHEERGRPRPLLRHHVSVDRSNSYPADTPAYDSMSAASGRCLDETREAGYLSLEDFRHEQLRRGILVRNPTQPQSITAPPSVRLQVTAPPPRRRSDSSRPEPTSYSDSGSTSRTSCTW